MYFAWLGFYTRALTVPAALGVVVEILSKTSFDGVDKNPFTLAYTFFLALWANAFLSQWKQEEQGYAFLWGSRLGSTFCGKKPCCRG